MPKIDVEVGLRTGAFQTGLAQMRSQTRKWSTDIAGMLAGAFATGAIINGIQAIVNKADQIQDLSDRFGVASDTLQRFGNVAVQNGSSMEAFAAGFNKLIINSQAAINGNEKLQQTFLRLGLTLEQLRTLSPEQQMLAIADAAKISSDPAQAFSDIIAVLGKGAGQLVPTLRQGAQAIQEFGDVMDEATVKELASVKDSYEEFGNFIFVWGGKFLGWLSTFVKVNATFFQQWGQDILNIPQKLMQNGVMGIGDAFNSLIGLNALGPLQARTDAYFDNRDKKLSRKSAPVIDETQNLESEQKENNLVEERQQTEQEISTTKQTASVQSESSLFKENTAVQKMSDLESQIAEDKLAAQNESLELRNQELQTVQQIASVQKQGASQPIDNGTGKNRYLQPIQFSDIRDSILPDTFYGDRPQTGLAGVGRGGIQAAAETTSALTQRQIKVGEDSLSELRGIHQTVKNFKMPELPIAQFS